MVMGFFLFFSACESIEKSLPFEGDQLAKTSINIEEISTNTGITFEVLKSVDVGSQHVYKFFWICYDSDLTEEKIKLLAESIINDTISRKPRTYHAFKIHFFRKCDVEEKLEDSISIATACFLPEGDWTKVGRVPIDNYTEYSLVCTFEDNGDS
ncbi:MAG: hypothetical protein L6425_02015 [Candidatus Aminicenantes bacterium]|nr:hypothetical protein [Candidatus Aminicenantes bacterium]